MKLLKQSLRTILSLSLIAFAFTFSACSDDSDDNDNEVQAACETLLECQDGTVWMASTIFGDYYIELRNNLRNPFTAYADFGGCFEKTNAEDLGIITIDEHTANMIVIKDTGFDYEEISTITYANNEITVKIEYYEDGVLDETQTIVLTKTDINLSSLNLCT